MKKVLLVENDINSREFIATLLKKNGLEVFEAINGEAGVQLALIEKPDLILMDIQLPLMDGFKATDLLRNRKETKNLPIIAVSAHVMNGDRQRAFDVGFTDYIMKPFAISKFLEVVKRYLA